MGEQVGSIEVHHATGPDAATFERRLLEDVAAQAGVAFRNALLEAELAARVEQTEVQSAELAASRRRLVGVEDEARERLAGAIRRERRPAPGGGRVRPRRPARDRATSTTGVRRRRRPDCWNR